MRNYDYAFSHCQTGRRQAAARGIRRAACPKRAYRLLQVANQTLLLRISPNEIGVSVYGADHVLKTNRTLPVPDDGGYWPLRDAYNIGGRAVLFTCRQGADKRISLHRIVLNEAGTAKESEDLIGSVPHISVMDRMMKRIGHLVDPYLSVVKDPNSDA